MEKNALPELLTCAFTPTIFMSMPLAAQTIKAGSDASGMALGKKIVERRGGKNRVQLEAGKGAGFFFAPPA